MNSKLETKRLLIYLILSFGMAWAIFFVFILTGHTWVDADQSLLSFVSLGMLCPVIAHLLTRWITREGYAMTGEGSMLLGISFKNKKWIFFLFAMLIPWVYGELGNGLVLLFSPACFEPEYYKILEIEKKLIPIIPITCIVTGTIGSFAAFGEEGGWRGYMMPKLISLIKMKKAVIVGGIIWGLWHVPLICVGHNFGMDYPGFPYLGVLAMCIYPVFTGIILTYVTVRSQSVWPAAILHGVNNASPSILQAFMNPEKFTGLMSNSVARALVYAIPVMIIGCICLWRLCRDNAEIKACN